MSGGNPVLAQALSFARHGWPVFPCQPDGKAPATTHGLHDASTDPGQITAWFDRGDRNLAVATGAPGPDVLDVDVHHDGDGFAALSVLTQARMTRGARALVRTPSGGLHLYFAGSAQRNGHLPGHHLDFRSAGGYVLTPPSRVAGKPYKLLAGPGGRASLDWGAVTRLLKPARAQGRADRSALPAQADHLAGWVARLAEGNRNAGLYWAACRALEADPATGLDSLAEAASQAGLSDREITATLDSARKTVTRSRAGGHRQSEAGR